MNTQTESILAILASLLVIFTAVLDAQISAGISIVLLLAFGVYKFRQHRRQQAGPP